MECSWVVIWFLRIYIIEIDSDKKLIFVINRFIWYSSSILSMLIMSVFSVSLSSSVLSQCMWFNFSSKFSVLSMSRGSVFVPSVDCTWLVCLWCFDILLLYLWFCLLTFFEIFQNDFLFLELSPDLFLKLLRYGLLTE